MMAIVNTVEQFILSNLDLIPIEQQREIYKNDMYLLFEKQEFGYLTTQEMFEFLDYVFKEDSAVRFLPLRTVLFRKAVNYRRHFVLDDVPQGEDYLIGVINRLEGKSEYDGMKFGYFHKFREANQVFPREVPSILKDWVNVIIRYAHFGPLITDINLPSVEKDQWGNVIIRYAHYDTRNSLN